MDEENVENIQEETTTSTTTMETNKKHYVIGIDLGTTNSVVAVWKDGQIVIIPNDEGSNITPNYVSFTSVEKLIGEDAKDETETNNPLNTIYETKRIIGMKFQNDEVQEYIKQWPFKTVEGKTQGRIEYQVTFQNQISNFSPEQISSFVLAEMKIMAEKYLNCIVNDAVITVPAFFNYSQRQATKAAGEMAGLNVLRVLNEPAAAAIAYSFKNQLKKPELTILVFDFGGGSLDVAIVKINNGNFIQVLGKFGDCHLGGSDFDERIQYYLRRLFEKRFGLKDVSSNPEIMNRLLVAAEKAKKRLSKCSEATIKLNNLYTTTTCVFNFEANITRTGFELICQDLFENAIDCVTYALKNAQIDDKSEIDEILLVGGSTRIPKIIELLKDYFNSLQPNFKIHPDLAVIAYGAAVQGAILANVDDYKIKNLLLIDRTSLSLGIQVVGGIMHQIIQRNTCIPCSREEYFTTSEDNATSVTVLVYEGEYLKTSKNSFLGTMTLNNIPPAPVILINFRIDYKGILTVTATNTLDGNTSNLTMPNKDTGRPEKEESSRLVRLKLIKEIKEEHEDYEMMESIQNAKDDFKRFLLDMTKEKANSILLDEKKSFFLKMCEDLLFWLQIDKEITIAQMELKKKELTFFYQHLINSQPK